MHEVTFSFSFDQLNLNVPRIESVMGYKEGEDRALVSSLIREVLEEAATICAIKGVYYIFDDINPDNKSKSIQTGSVVFQVGRIIFNQIKKSESLAVFLCTAGEEIGLRAGNSVGGKDFLKAYVYDVVGSEIVEAAADVLQARLKQSMEEEGFNITNRFSPGYCSWDVSEQHKLFSLIPGNYCGIRLTDSALMQPVKSVSGIIGIGTNVRMNPYACNLCDNTNCIYRRNKDVAGK